MSECIHGMQEAWCATCKGSELLIIQLEGKTIAARYSGKCPGCGDRIVEGEDVHLSDVGWVDTACAERATAP